MINDLDIVQWAYLLDPCFQLVNTAGKPLTEGYIEVYYHGTRTKYYCASDFDGTLHPFQIPLDSLGSNIVLASPDYAYDVYVYNKFGSLVMSRYNVTPGLGGGGGGIPGSDLPEHWLGTDGEAINIASDAVNVCLPLPVSGSVDYEGEFVDHFDETTLYLNEGMYIVEAVIQFTQSQWDLHNSLNNLKIDTGDGDSSYYWQEDVSGPESNQNVHERKVTFIRKVSGEEPYPFFISPSVGVQLNDVKIRRLNIVKLAAGGTGGGHAPMYKPGPGIAVDDEGVISVTGMQPVSGMNEYVTNITYNNDVTEIFNEIHNVTGDITNIYNEIQSVTGDIHEYTAGSGIIIEDDVISIDPDYVASGAVTQEQLEGVTAVIENTIEGVSTTIINDVSGDISAVTSVLNDKIDAVSAAVPEAQVNADWNATEGKAEILNKPDLSVYATKDELQEVSSNVVSHDELQSVTSVIENTIEGVSTTIVETIEGATAVIENTIEGVSTTIVNEYTGDIESVTAVLNDKIDAVSAAVPEAQVNADWNATEGKAEILNKPDLSVYATKDEVETVTGVLQDELMSVSTTVSGIIADQVQSDWDEDDSDDPAYIKNKPEEIPLVAGENIYIERVQDTLVISASSVDLSPYATNSDLAGATAQLESEIQTVSSTIPDVSEFATRDEVSNATSVIENTIESVSTVIQNEIVTVSGEIPDISNLATKDELESASGTLDAKIDAVSGAVPEAQVNADWNATEGKAEILNKPDLTVYATKSEVESVASDLQTVSAAIPDISDLATKAEVQSVADDVQTVSAAIPDISDLATKDEVNTVAEFLEQDIQTVSAAIPDVSNFATVDELESASGTLDAKIDAVSASIPEAQVQSDWTETATGDPAYIKNKPAEYDLVAGQNIEITTSGDDIIINAVVPPVTGFATEQELQTVSSAIPDVSNFATVDEVNAVEQDVQIVSAAIPDISNLATKSEVESVEADVQTVSAAIPDISNLATKTEVEAVADDVQTVSSAIPDISNLATKTEVEAVEQDVQTVSGAIVHYQGASGVVVDGDTVSLDEPLMIEAGQGITFTAEGDTITISADVPTVTGFVTESELATATGVLENDIQTVSSAIPDISNLATKTEVQTVANDLQTVSSAIPDVSNLATESELQTVSSAVDAVSGQIPETTPLVAGNGISITEQNDQIIIAAEVPTVTGFATEAELQTVSAAVDSVSAALPEYPDVSPLIAGSGIVIDVQNDQVIISATGAVADSDVYFATVNTTTWQEVKDAYDAGKKIFAVTSNKAIMPLADYFSSRFYFATTPNKVGITSTSPAYTAWVLYTNNNWIDRSGTFQADWNETSASYASYIKNKPDLSVYATNADLQIVSAAVSGSTEYTGASGVVVDGDTITLDEPLMIEAGSGITFTQEGDSIIISSTGGGGGGTGDVTKADLAAVSGQLESDIQTVSGAIPSTANLATKSELATVSAAIPEYTGASGIVIDDDKVALDDPIGIVAGQGITFTQDGDDIIISAEGGSGPVTGFATEEELQIVSAAVDSVSAALPEYPEVTPLIAGSGITIAASGEAFVISNEDSVSAVNVEAGAGIDIAPSGNSLIFSWMNTAGITDIQIVASLPASPDAHTMYLIQET